ncbi:MAG: hypothetical protein R6U32_06695, partial [Candidatus Woesearchaeota archaeon]
MVIAQQSGRDDESMQKVKEFAIDMIPDSAVELALNVVPEVKGLASAGMLLKTGAVALAKGSALRGVKSISAAGLKTAGIAMVGIGGRTGLAKEGAERAERELAEQAVSKLDEVAEAGIAGRRGASSILGAGDGPVTSAFKPTRKYQGQPLTTREALEQYDEFLKNKGINPEKLAKEGYTKSQIDQINQNAGEIILEYSPEGVRVKLPNSVQKAMKSDSGYLFYRQKVLKETAASKPRSQLASKYGSPDYNSLPKERTVTQEAPYSLRVEGKKWDELSSAEKTRYQDQYIELLDDLESEGIVIAKDDVKDMVKIDTGKGKLYLDDLYAQKVDAKGRALGFKYDVEKAGSGNIKPGYYDDLKKSVSESAPSPAKAAPESTTQKASEQLPFNMNDRTTTYNEIIPGTATRKGTYRVEYTSKGAPSKVYAPNDDGTYTLVATRAFKDNKAYYATYADPSLPDGPALVVDSEGNIVRQAENTNVIGQRYRFNTQKGEFELIE